MRRPLPDWSDGDIAACLDASDVPRDYAKTAILRRPPKVMAKKTAKKKPKPKKDVALRSVTITDGSLPLHWFQNSELTEKDRDDSKAFALKNGEWVECDAKRDGELYQITLEDGSLESRGPCEVVFSWQDKALALKRLEDALERRARAEHLLRFQKIAESMPADELVVKFGPSTEEWQRIFRHCPRDPSLENEVVKDYVSAMNGLILRSSGIVETTEKKKPPPPYYGQVPLGAVEKKDFRDVAEAFEKLTFLGSPECVEAFVHVQTNSRFVAAVNFFAATEGTTPEYFSTIQTNAVNTALRQLKEVWLQRTAFDLRRDLQPAKDFHLDEGTMAAYDGSRLQDFLARVNFVMRHDLSAIVKTSLTSFASTIIAACEGRVTVASPSEITTCAHSANKNPLFYMKVTVVESTFDFETPLHELETRYPVPKFLSRDNKFFWIFF